jgi:hypothetical protein
MVKRNAPPGCEQDDIGEIDGNPVIVVTDGSGSNVIIGGHKHSIHYLSRNYGNHISALRAGKQVVGKGKIPKSYSNMKDEKQGSSASFMSLFYISVNSWAKRSNNHARKC